VTAVDPPETVVVHLAINGEKNGGPETAVDAFPED
jgi:hypothetical protein